jgi:hypothetical protein
METPWAPTHKEELEQNFFRTIYGNNFCCLAISIAQKIFFAYFSNFFSIKWFPWFLANDLRSEELPWMYMNLELSFK